MSGHVEDYADLRARDSHALRDLIRTATYQGHTAGLAAGKLQANLIILPEAHALDFMRFCQRNPKPCPLVGVSETGDPVMHTLGKQIDIRTDVPAYNVYSDGVLSQSVSDIESFWQPDHVAFALGCSFTFEDALSKAGILVWHIENNKTVPMYRSTIQTTPAGAFKGNMVVSMRAVDEQHIDEVVSISARYPLAHGKPVHIGDPAAIGVQDLGMPDWGDSHPELTDSQVPVFWACGVTPQNVLLQAELPLFISHKPGHMLVTDIDEQAEVPVYQ